MHSTLGIENWNCWCYSFVNARKQGFDECGTDDYNKFETGGRGESEEGGRMVEKI